MVAAVLLQVLMLTSERRWLHMTHPALDWNQLCRRLQANSLPVLGAVRALEIGEEYKRLPQISLLVKGKDVGAGNPKQSGSKIMCACRHACRHTCDYKITELGKGPSNEAGAGATAGVTEGGNEELRVTGSCSQSFHQHREDI